MVAEEFGFTVEFVSADVTASVVQDSQNQKICGKGLQLLLSEYVDHGKLLY